MEPNAADTLEPGTRVEVRNRFDSTWSSGFEIATVDRDGYTVRRLTDDLELPTIFGPDDLRVERAKKKDMWWI